MLYFPIKKFLVNTCWPFGQHMPFKQHVILSKIVILKKFDVVPESTLVNKCWPNLCWPKSMMSQLSKTESDVILRFLEWFLCFYEKTSFFAYKIMHKSKPNFFIGQFFKEHVLWCSSDYGDQKQPNGPPKPQIFNIVTHILHTPTLQFLRYLHFSNPYFWTFWWKGQQNVNKCWPNKFTSKSWYLELSKAFSLEFIS